MRNAITTSMVLFGLAGCQMAAGLPGTTTTSTTSGAAASAPPSAPPSAPTAAEPWDDPAGEFSTEPRTCDAAHDHCLRYPTFYDDGLSAAPAYRSNDGLWRGPQGSEVRPGRPILETRPATAADLVVGARIIATRELPTHEADAQNKTWSIGRIELVQGDLFKLELVGSMYPIGGARAIVGEVP